MLVHSYFKYNWYICGVTLVTSILCVVNAKKIRLFFLFFELLLFHYYINIITVLVLLKPRIGVVLIVKDGPEHGSMKGCCENLPLYLTNIAAKKKITFYITLIIRRAAIVITKISKTLFSSLIFVPPPQWWWAEFLNLVVCQNRRFWFHLIREIRPLCSLPPQPHTSICKCQT